jgi:hypothetical protein
VKPWEADQGRSGGGAWGGGAREDGNWGEEDMLDGAGFGVLRLTFHPDTHVRGALAGRKRERRRGGEQES